MTTIALGRAQTFLSIDDRNDLVALRETYNTYSTPDAATERALIAAAQAGDADARTAVVVGHWRAVASVAKRYTGSGVGIADLIQEGLLELNRRVDKFDLSLNNRLTTYALPWIDQRLRRVTLEQGSTITTAHTAAEKFAKMQRIVETFHKTHGRQANDEELCNLGVNPAEYHKLHSEVKRPTLSYEGMQYGHPSADSHENDCNDTVDMLELLEQLPAFQQNLIRLRVGGLTVEGIAARLGVPHWQVRRDMMFATQHLRTLTTGSNVWADARRFQQIVDELPTEPTHANNVEPSY